MKNKDLFKNVRETENRFLVCCFFLKSCHLELGYFYDRGSIVTKQCIATKKPKSREGKSLTMLTSCKRERLVFACRKNNKHFIQKFLLFFRRIIIYSHNTSNYNTSVPKGLMVLENRNILNVFNETTCSKVIRL